MSDGKSKFFIPAVGAALVVAGSVVAYMYFNGGPSGTSSDALGSAKLVPSTALMATYVTTDPQAWAKLQQFGTPEAQKLVAKGIEDFNKDFFQGSDISYEKDIKPWIGGVMLAVLPPNPAKPAQFNVPSQANPPITLQQEPKMLMIVGIKDKNSAFNLANRLKGLKNVKSQDSDYKGEKITETIENGKSTYSVVLNNSHLVLAPEKQAVENAIDTFKGQPSFASKEGASNILSIGVDVKNTLAQIYIPDYAGMIQQFIAASPQAKQLPPQSLAQLKQVKSMVAGVGVDDAGLRMKAIANLDPQASKFQYQTTPANIVGQFPIDTFALVNGKNINRSWSTLVEQSKDNPQLQQIVQQLRGQLRIVNIDLDKDVFDWMNGEFAFGAIPSNQGILASLGFGGALVFDTSDRKTAEATFTKLDNLAKTQSLNITQRKIAGKNVTEWQIPQQGALLAHGWLDQDTVFLALGGPIAESLTANKNQSLENSENFKAVTGSLQKPNGGYFYLDMEKTASLINSSAARQSISPEASAILSSIRGVSATATSPNNSTSQLELLLALKPNTAK
ncbi:DUF3352 domain-containing protein [Nostoc sp. CENA67]|uniref:DUF3352 domain-containing protein n=1 Tax=Amazonocrinis nigriterrae CENA67 TaxID=2794033 RepID=A0A8J7LAN4_9NOST|nr:DUF3352 domain-containing protein [Amazonocrinis nigriterrae]MBH8565628.1 DUF3352 domain-containing protein [Amazonocrinis nigriterrae CENA67]